VPMESPKRHSRHTRRIGLLLLKRLASAGMKVASSLRGLQET
jgi:hypothetical protein